MLYVYTLRSVNNPEQIYVGLTVDVDQRLEVHNSANPIRISWSRLQLFLECSRCFYLCLVAKPAIKRPDRGGFTLHRAVDTLLQTEFDLYRIKQKRHPLFFTHKIDKHILPAQHKMLKKWRTGAGIIYAVPHANLVLCGKIDDLWRNTRTDEWFVVEYKATSTNEQCSKKSIRPEHKLQVEFYQWLLRKNDVPVASMAYFVYCNGKKQKERFRKRLGVETTLMEYEIVENADWVEKSLMAIEALLKSPSIPAHNEQCKFCEYVKEIADYVEEANKEKS